MIQITQHMKKKIEAYDLTDGNRYNLTAGVSADLRKGIFVPIVIKAENGKTDIKLSNDSWR